ncbi:MAG: N-acetylmuramoyl-L-alanine amidase [Acidobacteriota bacterium]
MWRWIIAPGWFVITWLVIVLGGAPATAEQRVVITDDQAAVFTDDATLALEAKPLRGEGLLAFSRRLTDSASYADVIAAANGGARALRRGVFYRVPFDVLTEANKTKVLRSVFPEDQPRFAGWEHVITAETIGAGLWRLSEWFTGDPDHWAALRDDNNLPDDTLRPGQRLLIRRELLVPGLRATLPISAPAADDLEYKVVDRSPFAVYRLRQGEALYSSVVVRFTGRLFAEDVNALANELAAMNGIPDVTDIAIGEEIRIPLDLLSEEYLPAGDPRRQRYEQGLADSEQFSNTVAVTRLEGVTVILDPGHGGSDPGASPFGVWESTYVYDIALRARKLLEEESAAIVRMTTRDGDSFRLLDRDVLPHSQRHVVLTTPPYLIRDAKANVHLRWYLANSIYRQALTNQGDEKKVVFISIHADALHSSVRGAMAYVPSASLTQGDFGKRGRVYDRRAEVREQRTVSYSWTERTRSEGLSRDLAGEIIDSFRARKLAVHHNKPIRDRIIRSRRSRPFVPAVMRYNAVPAKTLIEVANLNNDKDRRLIQERGFRDQVARAIVDGILRYYGQSTLDGPGDQTVAR